MRISRRNSKALVGETKRTETLLMSGDTALVTSEHHVCAVATAEPIAMPSSIAMPEAMVLPLAVDGNNRLLADEAVQVLSNPSRQREQSGGTRDESLRGN